MLNGGKSDLVENRRYKYKMAKVLKRETSQPHYLDYNQAQGSKGEESVGGHKVSNDHGCLKASIWNKPSDDPRYVLRLGTSKIRSQSEEVRVITWDDKEKEKEQFALYLKEVERRFKKSKIKGYKFLKSQKLSQLSKSKYKMVPKRREKSK